MGTYRGYVHWVWVRCGYGAGIQYGYGTRTVPVPKSTYLRTVPYLTPLGMYTVPPCDAQIENLDFITLKINNL